jgi:penicillin-binding protein 1A
VMEPAAPEGVVFVGGEWFYDEYARGQGIRGVGMGDAGEKAPEETETPTTADEKKKITDLFKN